MVIVDGPCWKCGITMKVAAIYSEPLEMLRDDGTHLNPSSFNEQEVEIARSKGVLLQPQHSKTMEQTYLANTCGNKSCGTFAGNFFLFQEYISPAGFGELAKEELSLGLMCPDCD